MAGEAPQEEVALLTEEAPQEEVVFPAEAALQEEAELMAEEAPSEEEALQEEAASQEVVVSQEAAASMESSMEVASPAVASPAVEEELCVMSHALMVESVWAQIGVPVYTDLLAVDVKQITVLALALPKFSMTCARASCLESFVPSSCAVLQ